MNNDILNALTTKYTYTLADLVENEGVELFNFEYDLPEFVDKEELELRFYQRYYFREIGSETIDRWLIQLEFKWKELCYKYADLFKLFEQDFLADDRFSNNDLSNTARVVFSDTPQSKDDTLKDYATTITESNTDTTGGSGEYKFRLISDYANKLRHIMYELIDECEPLFMQIF